MGLLRRRTLLHAALGAAIAAGVAPSRALRAASARPGSEAFGSALPITQSYALLRGAGEGRPAYWISRGMRHGQRGPELVPLNRSIMVSAVVFTARADGAVVSRILEAGVSLAVDGRTPIDAAANPFAAGSIKVGHIAPMTAGYVLHPDGRLQMPEDDPRRSRVEFRGHVTPSVAFQGELAVDERFDLRNTSPSGAASWLTEEITYSGPAPRRAGEPALDTRKRMSVIRNWTSPSTGDMAPSLIAVYEGRKLRSWEAAVDEAGREMLERVHPGFAVTLRDFR